MKLLADSTHVPPLQLSTRAALAAGAAVEFAKLLQLQYPIYALIGAVIVTDLSPSQTQRLALRPLAGTVVGAMVGATFSSFLQQGTLIIGVSILVAMFLSHLFRLETAATIAGYVCGIVVLDHGRDPWVYALHRLVETVLGIGTAVLVSLVPKLIRVKNAEQQDRT
jgi:uncharacterized membrane protein YgaE (UPF0421/DUF939 family)